MKICGVIAEFNPFHNGHKFLLDNIRSLGYDAIICVMSGNFVQRGDLSAIDKKIRAEIAVKNGADLVLSLPFPWSSATAEFFARAGVSILDNLGCVEALCFGSECGDISMLSSCSEMLLKTTVDDIKELQKKDPSTSFARARQEYILNNFGLEASEVLSSPNDILATEYIKSIKKLGSNIKPFTIKRNNSSHDGTIFTDTITSSSKIRELAKEGLWNEISPLIPDGDVKYITTNFRTVDNELFYSLILGAVLSHTPEELASICEIFGGFEYALYREALSCTSYENLVYALKAKHLTDAKIRRALLFASLWVEKSALAAYPAFTEVLCTNEVGQKILSKIRKTSKIEVLSKIGNIKSASILAKEQFKLQRKSEMIFDKILRREIN